MFQENLLESSTRPGRRKRWPMATAFLLEIAVAAVLITVPLVSSGVIPVFAHAPIIAPITSVKVATTPPRPGSSGRGSGRGSSSPTVVVIPVCNGHCGHIDKPGKDNDSDLRPNLNPDGTGHTRPDLMDGNSEGKRPRGPGTGPLRISNPTEAQLLKKVEPAYPRVAQLASVSGVVKLHAIIAKDGSIQSLSVISGHPLLAPAAVEAVRQWRYRPYRLNGEVVEVETFITVNFKRER